MVKTTRAQREALLKRYKWASQDSIPFNRQYLNYRAFRRAVQQTFGCDGAVVVQWCGMWLCIEADGYTHS